MPAATATSQRNRQRLDAPQIGEGLWSVFDAQGCCIVQFATAVGDANGFKLTTTATGVGPVLSVQGAAADINLTLAAQGAGFVVISGPLEVTGAVTLDATLLVKGAATFQAALTQSGGTASFDSPTLVVDETNHRVGVGTLAPVAKLDVTNGAVRALDGTSTIPASGTGVELITTGGVGFIHAANRSGGVNIELDINATPLKLNVGTLSAITLGGATTANLTLHVVGAVTFDSTLNVGGLTTLSAGLTVTGDITLTGVLRHSSVGASLIIPSAAGWVVMNNAAGANNLTVSDLGAVTTRSTLTVSGGGASITGNITLSGVLAFTATSSQVIPGTLSWSVLKNDQSRANLQILDSGATTIQGGVTITTGGLTVTLGGITITAGDLILANAQLKRGTDTWLLPTGLGSDTLVTLTATQSLTNKTLGTGTKIILGGDAVGDLYYGAASNVLTKLPAGTTAQVLLGQGAGVAPSYGQVDRTRVVLTTATGIMTLHDAQTADAAKTFTAQVICGPSGTGTHQLVCASSAPSGAIFTSSQIGVYGSTVTNIMQREMTDSIESDWDLRSTGVTFGVITAHSLQLTTANVARLTIASGGDVTVANNLIVTGDITGGTVAWKGLKAATAGQASIDSATTAVNTGALTGAQMNIWAAGNAGPTSININKWLKVNVGTSSYFIPLFV